MKRWIQWGVTVVLATGSMLGWSLWTNRVLALTQTEIVQKLQTVPVFILLDNAGRMVPLFFNDVDQGRQPFVGIFMSYSDAQETLAMLQNESADANQFNAILLSLADAYSMILESQDLENAPPFGFIPQQEQLELAAQVLDNEGEDIVLSPLTVPLFYLGSTTNDSFITISAGESDRESIPLFFDGNEAQVLLDLLNEQANANAEAAPSIELRVAFLDPLLRDLETNDEDILQLVELEPSLESRIIRANVINQLRQQQLQSAPEQTEVVQPSPVQSSPEDPLPEAPNTSDQLQSTPDIPVTDITPRSPADEGENSEQPPSESLPIPEAQSENEASVSETSVEPEASETE
ncbi:MAG: Tic22 family protein [Cyanobacteria bacterium P01_F01_bin.150]